MTTNCKIELFGTLAKPAKLVSKNDLSFVVLSVATRDCYTDNRTGKVKENTLWHEVVSFDAKTIETAKGMQKGEQVQVFGTLSYKGVDSLAGYKIRYASIVASSILPAH